VKRPRSIPDAPKKSCLPVTPDAEMLPADEVSVRLPVSGGSETLL